VNGKTNVSGVQLNIGDANGPATLNAAGGLDVGYNTSDGTISGLYNSIINFSNSSGPGFVYESYNNSLFEGKLTGTDGLVVATGQSYTLELANAHNDYSGGTNVESGLLQLDYGGALPQGQPAAEDGTPMGDLLQIGSLGNGGVLLNSDMGTSAFAMGFGASSGGPVAAPAGMSSAVPEPGTLLLLAAGAVLAGLAAWRRRRTTAN
jgi:autotransporter-associated beta strand protein